MPIEVRELPAGLAEFRPRAVRIDSTVIEADVRYPTDADPASHGGKALAREGRTLPRLVGEKRVRVRDRS